MSVRFICSGVLLLLAVVFLGGYYLTPPRHAHDRAALKGGWVFLTWWIGFQLPIDEYVPHHVHAIGVLGAGLIVGFWVAVLDPSQYDPGGKPAAVILTILFGLWILKELWFLGL